MSRLDYCQYELVDDCYDWKNDHCDGCNIFKAYCEGARRAKNSIVRCKDCRHQKFYINDKESFHCDKSGVVNMHMEDGDGEFFCSYGERKDK